jgi:hypothetical protein
VGRSISGEVRRAGGSTNSENEVARLGSIAELLVGLTTEDVGEADDANAGAEPADLRVFAGDRGTWSVVDAIPSNTMCAVALIEHRWAIPLRHAIQKTGGRTLADAWIHPGDPVLARLECTGIANARR